MKKILMLGALLALGSVAALASDTCTGTLIDDTSGLASTGTYYDPTYTCTSGGFTFSNFQVLLGAGFSDTDFSFGFIAAPDGTVNFTDSATAGEDFQLTFTITPGPSAVTLTGSGPTGTGINEEVCSQAYTYNTGAFSCGGAIIGSGSVSASGTTTFTTSQTGGTDGIFKDVDGQSEFQQAYAPEPMTMSLMGVGLLGLGILGRRRSRR